MTLALASCNKPDPDDNETPKTPSISMGSALVSINTYNAGTHSFYYTINNPVDGGTVSCETSVDWITSIDCSVSGTVNFDVTANDTDEQRSGNITLYYNYSGGSVNATVIVTQNCDNTVRVDAVYSTGIYFGDTYESNMYEYYVAFSDNVFDYFEWDIPIGTSIYIFDFWSATAADQSNIKIPEGTYTYGEEEQEHRFSEDESGWIKITGYDEYYDDYDAEEYEFVSGTVEVSYEGDVCSITASVKDEEGISHEVTYSGTISFLNLAGLWSVGDDNVNAGPMAGLGRIRNYLNLK